MIYRPGVGTVRARKWSLTANDSHIEPQMILKLNRKWSRTGNDPNIRPQVMEVRNKEWYAFILEDGKNRSKNYKLKTCKQTLKNTYL